MAIQVGDPIPNVKLQTIEGGGLREVWTGDLCRGKRVVLFAVPGAFTGTCSYDHLPGFVERAAEVKAKGVDVLACVAVNDVSVMNAWASVQGVGDRILMLADGNGDFARAMGLELDSRPFGMGIRSQRYAAIVEDGVVKLLNVDSPGEVRGSGVEAVLQKL
jgi:glutaredoxin/glutathione-dependent peroxiredoxin